MTRFSVDELKDCADAALAFAMRYLQSHGDFQMMMHVIPLDGPTTIIGVNSPAALPAAVSRIQAMVDSGAVQAIITMTDAFVGAGARGEVEALLEAGIGVEEGVRLGMIDSKSEAVVVALDSALYRQVVTQAYTRTADDAIVPGKRMVIDEVAITRHPVTNFFKHGRERVV